MNNTCPNCGYCPHCGRSDWPHRFYQYKYVPGLGQKYWNNSPSSGDFRDVLHESQEHYFGLGQ